MKYLLVEAIKEEKKRGVLSEYETSSQFNANEPVNENNRRESCNSSNGLASIGSLLFQSSVKSMNKKYSDTMSIQSASPSSSSASTVSSSSSVSTSSLSVNTSKQVAKQASTPNTQKNHYQFANAQPCVKQNLFINNNGIIFLFYVQIYSINHSTNFHSFLFENSLKIYFS